MIEKKFIIPDFEIEKKGATPLTFMQAEGKFVDFNIKAMNEIIELSKNSSIDDVQVTLEFEKPKDTSWPRALRTHQRMINLFIKDALTTEYDLFVKLAKKDGSSDKSEVDYATVMPKTLLVEMFNTILYGSTTIERKRFIEKDTGQPSNYYFEPHCFFAVNGFFIFNPYYRSSDDGLAEDVRDYLNNDVLSFNIKHSLQTFKIYMTRLNDIKLLSKSLLKKLLSNKATVGDLPIQVVTRCILKEYYYYETISILNNNARTSLSKLSLELKYAKNSYIEQFGIDRASHPTLQDEELREVI